MYPLPSLAKMAYYACNNIERDKFDLLDTPDVSVRNCCEALFELFKVDKKQDEHNDRRTMFRRSRFAINDDTFKHICEKAAFNGHIGCLKLAHEIGVPWDTVPGWTGFRGKACDLAAGSGNLECLRYASVNGCRWDGDTCSSAASNGHLECLKYARENGCPWDKRTCMNAAYHDQFECLVYAYEGGCKWEVSTFCFRSRYSQSICAEYAREIRSRERFVSSTIEFK
ncbi:uncharacterized protein LOC103308152 isoform X4 [Acyrthosiphon pisum]|uniref:Uncharacterized protein n=1 Tax=Acyrthosiphon pisum TaxID=7029 RepID=A0A8R2NU01_ACYPI|nr:uncharacterized protein LOC103308152 isoform X4 [Acyrthosiphon pisum]